MRTINGKPKIMQGISKRFVDKKSTINLKLSIFMMAIPYLFNFKNTSIY